MKELYQYNKQSRGYSHNIPMLSERIQMIADHYSKKENYKMGLNPFIFGRDYAPSMNYEES